MAFTARVKQARERIHLLLIDEAGKGFDDLAAGKVKDAKTTLTALKAHQSQDWWLLPCAIKPSKSAS